MNLLNLITSKMKLNPQMLGAIKQAISLASNYQNNIEGLKQAINENGGMNNFKKGLQYLNNPQVTSMLNKLGIDVNTLKNISNEVISNTNSNNKNIDNIKNRLSKL